VCLCAKIREDGHEDQPYFGNERLVFKINNEEKEAISPRIVYTHEHCIYLTELLPITRSYGASSSLAHYTPNEILYSRAPSNCLCRGHPTEALMPATPHFATLRARQGLALPNHTMISAADGREKFGPGTRWRLEAQRRCFFSGLLPGEVTLDARVRPR
jgi:hypothetical protein